MARGKAPPSGYISRQVGGYDGIFLLGKRRQRCLEQLMGVAAQLLAEGNSSSSRDRVLAVAGAGVVAVITVARRGGGPDDPLR